MAKEQLNPIDQLFDPENNDPITLLDNNNNNIAKILYNPGHYFNIEINEKSYELTNIDNDSLTVILSK